MLKSKKYTFIVCVIFIFTELLLSFGVHLTSGRTNDFISVGAIFAAFVFAFFFFDKENDYYLVQTGLFCTFMADVFLLIAEPHNQTLSMLFFSVTQMCYFVRLYLRDEKHKAAHLTLRISVTVIALIATCVVLGEKTDPLSLISLFYFANLSVNVIWAFVEYRTSRLFGAGLLLFLLCDICVGLSVMSADYIPVGEDSFLYFLIHPGFNLAWSFYIPSQVLIVLSLAEDKIKKSRKI